MILVCLLVAIATDLTSRIIPNRLVIVALGCGVGLRLLSGPWSLLASLLCAIAILAALSPLAANDLLGWGDAKLIVAVSFAVPAHHVLSLLLAIAMAGGLVSCLYLAARVLLRRAVFVHSGVDLELGLRRALHRLVRREGARILANEPMPYALAVFGGVAYGFATK